MDTGYSLSLNSQSIVLHELSVQTYFFKKQWKLSKNMRAVKVKADWRRVYAMLWRCKTTEEFFSQGNKPNVQRKYAVVIQHNEQPETA